MYVYVSLSISFQLIEEFWEVRNLLFWVKPIVLILNTIYLD